MRVLVVAAVLAWVFLQFNATVERVVDGDTLIVRYDGARRRLRLLCIDTPESKHPDRSKNTEEGRRVAQEVEKVVDAAPRWVHVEVQGRDRYGRLLGHVHLWVGWRWVHLNRLIVEKGWSKYETKWGKCKQYHKALQDAEGKATASSKGI